MASDGRVVLVSGDHETWALQAAEMAARIAEHLPSAKIEHIGSTAVSGMPAKPVVDLAVGVADGHVGEASDELVRCGFDLEGNRPGHAWLSYPERSARSFVVHVLEFGGPEWNRRVRFRDILITDKGRRAKYLAVKRAAAAVSRGWGEYTRAKSAVVAEILDEDAARSKSPAGGMGNLTTNSPQ